MEPVGGSGFFKVKPNKRSTVEERTTLDVIHQKQLSVLKEEETHRTILESQVSTLQAQIDATQNDIQRGQLELKLSRVKEEYRIKQKTDRIYDYFLNTGDVLFQYYEMQDAIAAGASSSMMSRSKRKPGDVLSALECAIEQEKQEQDSPVPAPAPTQPKEKGKPKANLSRDNLLEQYLQKIDPGYQKKHSEFDDTSDECMQCGTDMIFSQNEASLYCPECGCIEFILIDSDRPSYKDPPRESSYYAYKRINHFNELLAQFQAKETKEIPEETFALITAELKKQWMTDTKQIKYRSMREILRKLKLNDLYDHIPHILARLNGQNTPVMDRETEEKLRHMFKEIQPSFQKHCPKNRRNFLSYAYVLYKFCELLELDEFLENFPLLKNRDKLYQQSKVWQKICEDMKWEFIASV